MDMKDKIDNSDFKKYIENGVTSFQNIDQAICFKKEVFEKIRNSKILIKNARNGDNENKIYKCFLTEWCPIFELVNQLYKDKEFRAIYDNNKGDGEIKIEKENILRIEVGSVYSKTYNEDMRDLNNGKSRVMVGDPDLSREEIKDQIEVMYNMKIKKEYPIGTILLLDVEGFPRLGYFEDKDRAFVKDILEKFCNDKNNIFDNIYILIKNAFVENEIWKTSIFSMK